MNVAESDIQARILLRIGALPDSRWFRNHVGEGWHGRVVDRIPLIGHYLILAEPRRVTFGLAPGSSDIVGWRTITVTPDDVGRRIAQFSGLEIKTLLGKAAKKQRSFDKILTEAGGLSGIARSPDEAFDLVYGA